MHVCMYIHLYILYVHVYKHVYNIYVVCIYRYVTLLLHVSVPVDHREHILQRTQCFQNGGHGANSLAFAAALAMLEDDERSEERGGEASGTRGGGGGGGGGGWVHGTVPCIQDFQANILGGKKVISWWTMCKHIANI